MKSAYGRQTWEVIVAASTGDVATLQRLLEPHPRLARAEYWYATAVHFAAREGHLDAVRPALVASTISRQRLGRDLMMLFGLVALALAAVGIYGMIAYTSSQRSGEMATRMALGATPVDIFWLIVSQGRILVASGSVLGVAVAYTSGRLASSWLYEVRASDPVILAVALGLVLGIAVLATVLPASRAARLEAARALRMG